MTGCTGRSLAVSSVLLSLRDLVFVAPFGGLPNCVGVTGITVPRVYRSTRQEATSSQLRHTPVASSSCRSPSHRRAVGSVLEYAGSFVTGTCCETAVHSGCLLRRVFGSEFDERSVLLPWQLGGPHPPQPIRSLTRSFAHPSHDFVTRLTMLTAHIRSPFAFRGARFTHASLSFAATQRAPPQRRLAGPE